MEHKLLLFTLDMEHKLPLFTLDMEHKLPLFTLDMEHKLPLFTLDMEHKTAAVHAGHGTQNCRCSRWTWNTKLPLFTRASG